MTPHDRRRVTNRNRKGMASVELLGGPFDGARHPVSPGSTVLHMDTHIAVHEYAVDIAGGVAVHTGARAISPRG